MGGFHVSLLNPPKSPFSKGDFFNGFRARQ
jgi:hypothetical protein